MTPIINKAKEVRYWMARRVAEAEHHPNLAEIRRYVMRRWPLLLPEIREEIVEAAISQKAAKDD